MKTSATKITALVTILMVNVGSLLGTTVQAYDDDVYDAFDREEMFFDGGDEGRNNGDIEEGYDEYEEYDEEDDYLYQDYYENDEDYADDYNEEDLFLDEHMNEDDDYQEYDEGEEFFLDEDIDDGNDYQEYDEGEEFFLNEEFVEGDDYLEEDEYDDGSFPDRNEDGYDREEWNEDEEEEEDPFDDLQEAQYDQLDTEFERHDESIDALFNQIDESTTDEELARIQKQAKQEIETHYGNIAPYATQEGRQLLEEDKAIYLEEISDPEMVNEFLDGEFTDYENDDDVNVNAGSWGEDSENDDYYSFDDPFENLVDSQRDSLEDEFERHDNTIEALMDEFEEVESDEKKEELRTKMKLEIENHFELLVPYSTEEGKDLLAEDKKDYLAYISDSEFDESFFEGNDRDEEENFEDDDREETIFGEDPNWDEIDAVFDLHDERIDDLFKQLEDQIEAGEEVIQTKKALLEQTEKMYIDLVPYSTQEGKTILDEEKADLLDYVENFEQYEEEEYQDEDGEGYPALKDLSEVELETVDILRSTHEDAMDVLYAALEETDEAGVDAIKEKLLAEIQDVYTKLVPYISLETLSYLEEEKLDYKKFIEEEAIYMCCGRSGHK